MENSSFQAVVDRLINACSLPNETALAKQLGFKQPVFATRKMRDSMPRAEMDAFIHAKGLNPEWVYEGAGSMFRDKSLARKIGMQNDIHARLDKFALNERQRSYMAKLLLSLETADPARLKELLDASIQLTADEASFIKGLRAAPPELVPAMRQILTLVVPTLKKGKTL